MRIVPAVDIRGGRCVRLIQGDYDRETVFSEDPVAQAEIWYGALGGGILHIVDLDGAKSGECCILPQLEDLSELGIPYEVGGGIRLLETIRQVIQKGAMRVVLGTAAHRDSLFLREACRVWPGRVAVGIDARKGMVALNGWLEETRTPAVEFAQDVAAAGAARIIYTDITRDGTMNGPNFEATRAVAKAVGIPVTLSGGVSSLEDIRKARDLEEDGVDEIIIGRALYQGAFTIQEAKAALQG